MSSLGSILFWLLKLPFRPVLRWFTGLFVLVLALGWWTGYLDLAGRHIFWRYWNYSTPLLAQAPANAKSLLLVDLTRPGISGLAPLAQSARIKKSMQELTTSLGIYPPRDLLQMLFVVDAKGQSYRVYSGRFMPETTRAALASQGFKAQQKGRRVLYTQAASTHSWLWIKQSMMLFGPNKTMAEFAQSGVFPASIISNAQFMNDLQIAGNRHVLTSVIRNVQQNNGARLIFTLDSVEQQQVAVAAHVFSADASQSAALHKDIEAALAMIKGASGLMAGVELNALIQSSVVKNSGSSVVVQSQCSAEQLAAIIGKSEKGAGLLNLAAGTGLNVLLTSFAEWQQDFMDH